LFLVSLNITNKTPCGIKQAAGNRLVILMMNQAREQDGRLLAAEDVAVMWQETIGAREHVKTARVSKDCRGLGPDQDQGQDFRTPDMRGQVRRKKDGRRKLTVMI